MSTRVRSSFRITVTSMVALACAVGPARLSPASNPPPADPDAARLVDLAGTFDRYARLMTGVAATVDRTRFDPHAVVAQVGTDPAKLADWVARQTRFIPYPGCLRGPVGVLQDRSGNSLDRALLLARLVRLAHGEARLAHATLPAAAVTDLLTRAAAAAPPVPPPVDTDAADDAAIAKIASVGGVDPGQVREVIEGGQLESDKAAERFVGAVHDTSVRLTTLLANAVRPSAGATDDDDRAAAADHWWVQYRAAGGPWVDADPQATDLAKPLCPAAESLDLPDDWAKPLVDRKLTSRFGVRMRVERVGPAGAEQFTVLQRWFDIAQLSGHAVMLNLAPLRWPGGLDLLGTGSGDKLRAALLDQHAWLPTVSLDGDDQPAFDQSFDDAGQLDPHPKLDAMGKLGNTITAGLGGAAGLLDAPPAPPQTTLTAVWLELDLTAPGRPTRTVRRDVYDRFPLDRRRPGSPPIAAADAAPPLPDLQRLRRSAALYRSVDLLPVGSTPSSDFVTATVAAYVRAVTPTVSAALRQGAGGATGPAAQQVAGIHPRPISLLALASLRATPAGLATGMAVDRPGLFARHHALVVHDDGTFAASDAIDIAAADVRVPAGDAVAAQVRQGVIDTCLEASLLGAAVSDNTAVLFRASAAQSVPWSPVRSSADPALAQLRLSATARARIDADLAAGYVVVAPQRPVTVDGQPREGWWRVDPRTGGTVGMMASGYGAASVEYSGLVYTIAWANGILAFVGCGGDQAVAAGQTMKALGCAACGIASGVLTYFGGAGAAGSTTAAAKFASGMGGVGGGLGVNGFCTAAGRAM